MKYLIAIIVGILAEAFILGNIYLIGVFIAADWNCVNWHILGRMALGLFFIFAPAGGWFAGTAVYEHLSDRKILLLNNKGEMI